MTEDAANDHVTEPDTRADHRRLGLFRGLFVTVIEAARTRLDLAAVEAEIFLLRVIRMLLWALAALACALLALAFVVVAIVAALWDTHRMVGVLCGAGLFVALAVLFGWIASRTLHARHHMLDGTLAQLETDQQRASSQS